MNAQRKRYRWLLWGLMGLVFTSGHSRAEDEPRIPAATPEDDGWRATTPPELDALGDRLRRCLAHYYYRPENTAHRSPWGAMHAAVGFGVDAKLLHGIEQVNALGWLCWNAPCYGMRLMYMDSGRLRLRLGAGYQGHEGQFLCILAQSRVSKDFPIRVDGQSLTVADLIRYEQLGCRSGTELTFKLIGLSHYLDADASWQNAYGETWDIPRLIREELTQPVIGAACGGTHRLTGFSYAVNARRRSGQPMTGQWHRAEQYVQDYIAYALSLQNPDGSFSTQWFAGRADDGNIDRKLNTTGHTLEWLIYSLPADQRTDPRVIRSVEFLVDLMWTQRAHRWAIGPQGHATHALALYDEYVYGGKPGQRGDYLAQWKPAAGEPAVWRSASSMPREEASEQEPGAGERGRFVRRRFR